MSRNLRLLMLAIVYCLAVAAFHPEVVFAQKGKPMPQSTLVESQLLDGPLDQPHSIRSDGSGSYLDNRDDGVISVINSQGSWLLNVQNAFERRVVVNLGDRVGGQGQAPFTEEAVQARVQSVCPSSFLEMSPADGVHECSLGVAFDWGSSTSYRLVMSDDNYYTGSTNIYVECTAGGAGGCSAWKVSSFAGGSVGKLQSYPTKGKMTITERGLYRLNFEFVVTK